MMVAGIDGCRGGWLSFKVDLTSLDISVELVDLPALLKNKPDDVAILAIDTPIGLLDGPRACDIAAREKLGWPRRCSVFSPPCR
jgi:predicted RNase H-like nuclease